MAKKAAKKRSKKIPYTHTAHHHNESNNFLLIISGGFVVLIILLFLVGNSQSLFRKEYVDASEEVVTEEVADDVATINIGNNAFADSPMTVKVGDAVTFTNNDIVMHTATADDGSFDTGDIAPGDSKVIVLEKARTFSYHCTHHPDMVGSLVVEE